MHAFYFKWILIALIWDYNINMNKFYEWRIGYPVNESGRIMLQGTI